MIEAVAEIHHCLRKDKDFAFGPAHFASAQDPADTLRLACLGFGDFHLLWCCLWQIARWGFAQGADMRTWRIGADRDDPRMDRFALTAETSSIATSRRALVRDFHKNWGLR